MTVLGSQSRPRTVVEDADSQVVALGPDGDPAGFCFGMTDHVCQGLLNDSIRGGSLRGRKMVGAFIGIDHNSYAGAYGRL
ncbi:hypothetical protein [Arthrobacter sp. YN]|uniref:hypothetical protein n=1 Tax=Arthrobacter sp. YN TaxID=2020486 RepID=UPI001E3E6FD4|nr:hypothetical protein [Arthrobacter sp. YN]